MKKIYIILLENISSLSLVSDFLLTLTSLHLSSISFSLYQWFGGTRHRLHWLRFELVAGVESMAMASVEKSRFSGLRLESRRVFLGWQGFLGD